MVSTRLRHYLQSCKGLRVLFVVDAITRAYPLSVAASDRVEQTSGLQNAVQLPMPAGGDQGTARRSFVTWIDVASLLSVALLAIILFLDFADPGALALADYVNSFYVAGSLAAGGEFDQLYPGPDAV